MTRANIANIEGGKQRIYAHTLIELSRTLNVPLDELLAQPQELLRPTLPTMESFTSELAAKLPLKFEEVRELTAKIGYAQNATPEDLPPTIDEQKP